MIDLVASAAASSNGRGPSPRRLDRPKLRSSSLATRRPTLARGCNFKEVTSPSKYQKLSKWI
ncbi:hypothetical protein [Bradyrhizobium icense]|uniref:hypothetical protein n=1 Tax=Bradyrhizobium icense TaxID=1274631 RepID=UPI0012EA06B1|nr:hypothetical protein [Bradyrhizobium icense]